MRGYSGLALANAMKPMFKGDEYDELKLAQIARYTDALVTLVGRARDSLSAAEAMLQHESDLGEAVRNNRFEDRRLEDAIRVLAAIWRIRHRHFQPPLPGMGDDVPTLMHQWLAWLGRYQEGYGAPLFWRWILLIGYDTTSRADAAYEYLMASLHHGLAVEEDALPLFQERG